MAVERLLHMLHDTTSVGSNPARRQKDIRSNSNTTGGAFIIFSRKEVKRKVPMPNLELVILLKFKFKNIKKY